ncbi:MAG TPA: hypothetical protein VFJ22_10970 [Dermatophilaceae bacterium]|jgi:hypothetical protein|nr:hypothetical protein [Dermatophilaceae bacterium]
MKRLVVAGLVVAAGYGIYRLARAWAPDDLSERAHEFADAVRQGMAQREAELREALGMEAAQTAGDPFAVPAPLDVAAARALLDDPAGPRAR